MVGRRMAEGCKIWGQTIFMLSLGAFEFKRLSGNLIISNDHWMCWKAFKKQ
jgi:hypothetical protein